MAFQLPPNPKFQQFDTNGNPLTGGKLYTYLAGSSDPVSTYTDSSGATANTNPVILDARGEADVWISDNVIYKFVLTDASDVEIWSVDNISAAAGGSGGGGGNDEFVRVTGADLASQYLSEKLVAGQDISITTLNAGAVEQLEIASTLDTTNFVTTDTTQTITGAKTFSNDVTLAGTIGNISWNKATDTLNINGQTVDFSGGFNVSSTSGFLWKNFGGSIAGSISEAANSFVISSFLDKLSLNGVGIDLDAGANNIDLKSSVLLNSAVDTGSSYGSGKMVYMDPTASNELKVGDIPGSTSASQQIDSSGIKSGAVITATGGGTTWDLGVGEAYIMDYSDPLNIKPKHVTWTAQTGLTLTNLLTNPRTNVAIALDNTARPDVSFTNSFTGTIDGVSGTIYIAEKSASNFDSEETRLFAPIGRIVHTNQTTISFPVQLQQHTESVLSSYLDFVNLFPAQNVEGNLYTPTTGVNLSVDKSAGKGFRFGSNYTTDLDNPNIQDIPLASPTTHFYRYQDGAGGFTQTASSTVLDVAQYDNGTGTLASVNNNQWTIQPVWVFAGSGTMFIQYGQELFSSKASAIEALATFNPVLDDNLTTDAVFRGYFIVRGGGTDTNNTGDFEWRSPLSERGGGTGTSVVVDLQTAYESSFDPEIVTDATRGALTVKRGSALDTDNVIEVQNGAGTVNFSVDGNGGVSGTTFNGVALTDGGSATNFLAADGTYKAASTAPGGSDTQVQFNDGGAFGGDAGLTYNKTTDELTVGGSIKSDKFVGIGDTARDNSLSKWGTQSRFYPIATESLALFGDNQTAGGGFIANAYYDGTNWRSLSAGYCRYIFLSSFSGLYVVYGYNASVADEIITWTEDFRLSASGELTTRDYILSNKDLKADRFVGIGDTERDNALTDWSSQTRLFPFIAEGLSIYGDNVLTTTGGITTNAYNDGTDWRSIAVGECQYQIFGASGTLAFYSFTATSSDQIITWDVKFSVSKDGDAGFYGTVNLGSTTNSTPTNGDIWYDGTNTNIQGDVEVSNASDVARVTVEAPTGNAGSGASAGINLLMGGTGADWNILSTNGGNNLRFYAGGVDLMTLSSSGELYVNQGKVNIAEVLKLSSYTNSSPVEGDLWYDGTNLKFRDATTTRTISWT